MTAASRADFESEVDLLYRIGAFALSPERQGKGGTWDPRGRACARVAGARGAGVRHEQSGTPSPRIRPFGSTWVPWRAQKRHSPKCSQSHIGGRGTVQVAGRLALRAEDITAAQIIQRHLEPSDVVESGADVSGEVRRWGRSHSLLG
jgi:hypothetical protein